MFDPSGFLRRTVIRRIRELRGEDLNYYDNPLAGVVETRPLLPAGAIKRFVVVLLLWSVLTKPTTAAAFGSFPLEMAIAFGAGIAAVLLADLILARAQAGVPAADPEFATTGLLDLLAVEDELLVEREFAPRARSRAASGRIFVALGTVLLLALFYSGLRHLPGIVLHSPLLYGAVVVALTAAVLGAEWLWRLIGFPARVALRTAARYWPATFSIVGLLAWLGGWRPPVH